MLLCTLALLPLVGAPDAAAFFHPPAAAVVEDEKATEWADQPGKKALTKTIGKLRKAASDEMLRQGREEVLAFGPGAAPGLLAALGKEKNEDAADRFREALDSITTPAHTRLLAAEFDAKRAPTQLYAMRRAAELGDPGLREDVEARWSELQEMKADPKRKKKVTEELELHVAVLTLSTGSPASLAACLGVAGGKAYKVWEPTLDAAAANAGAAGAEVGDLLAEELSSQSGMRERLAALRLLTWAGHEAHAKAIAPALDARESNVKIEAINALRRIVDDEEPIARLSAFAAIEEAGKWKKRIGG